MQPPFLLELEMKQVHFAVKNGYKQKMLRQHELFYIGFFFQ